MERRNTAIVNLNSDSLFSIHVALKTRFDLDWCPNQSFITFFSPVSYFSIGNVSTVVGRRQYWFLCFRVQQTLSWPHLLHSPLPALPERGQEQGGHPLHPSCLLTANVSIMPLCRWFPKQRGNTCFVLLSTADTLDGSEPWLTWFNLVLPRISSCLFWDRVENC